MTTTVRAVLVQLFWLGVIVWMLTQVRRPTGPLGRFYLWGMNRSHSGLTDWALKQLPLGRDSAILDIGCGGGRTLQKLAAIATNGTVDGVDYSAASVAATRRTNADTIRSGRVKVERGSVAKLPYADQTFDVVTAVETHYYWPDLPANIREVLRVVKPGGTFAIVAETYRGGRFETLYRPVMKLIRAAYLSDAEHSALLTQAGFVDVSIRHQPKTSWICVIGKRPSLGEA